jgi:hypothetical protein
VKKAWITEVHGIKSLVAAETRGHAVSRTMASANDAGYGVKFPDVKAKRDKRFDGWAQTDEARGVWCPDFIAKREGIIL